MASVRSWNPSHLAYPSYLAYQSASIVLVSRYAPSGSAISFGPGPITPAVRAIIIANVAVFLVTFVVPELTIGFFGLSPAEVFEGGRIWQPVTYLFVHSPSSLMHVLFNMLAVWMFGVVLERR